jgi:hypothetical protein
MGLATVKIALSCNWEIKPVADEKTLEALIAHRL